MNHDLDIARSVTPRPIADVAADLGLTRDELILFGDIKAKVRLSAYVDRSGMSNGVYVDVTAITPTPLGEGKTTTTVGLVQGLARRESGPWRAFDSLHRDRHSVSREGRREEAAPRWFRWRT